MKECNFEVYKYRSFLPNSRSHMLHYKLATHKAKVFSHISLLTIAQRCNWWVIQFSIVLYFYVYFILRIKQLMLQLSKALFQSCIYKIIFLIFILNTTCLHLNTMSHSSSSSIRLMASSPPSNSSKEFHLDSYQSFLGWSQDSVIFYICFYVSNPLKINMYMNIVL